MKKTLILFVTFTALLSLTTCAAYIPSKLGYFELDPYARPFDQKIRQPLYLLLGPEVKDSVSLKEFGMMTVTATEYRRTVGKSLVATLTDNFEVVSQVDSRPDSGLVLEIYRIRPHWKINASTTEVTGADSSLSSSTTRFIAACFQVESSLFLAGKPIQRVDRLFCGENQTSQFFQAIQMFKDGLLTTCEELNKEVFTQAMVDEIANR